jgi:hypothetical protein
MNIHNKFITLIFMYISVFILSSYCFSCSDNNRNTPTPIENRVKTFSISGTEYQTIEEMAADSQLIIVGVVKEAGDFRIELRPGNSLYYTTSSLLIQEVVKGDPAGTIISVQQDGAPGIVEQVDDPIFHRGERVILFLKKDIASDIYYQPGHNTRYGIIDNKVYSMDFISEYNRYFSVPSERIFNGVKLDSFIKKLNENIDVIE